MIIHNWTVVCSKSTYEEGELNLFGIWGDALFSGPTPPARKISVPVKCEVVSCWIKSDGPKEANKAIIKAQELDPQGTTLATIEFPIDLSDVDRTYTVAQMDSMPIKTEGRYTFRLQIRQAGSDKWKIATKFHIDIAFHPTPTDQDK